MKTLAFAIAAAAVAWSSLATAQSIPQLDIDVKRRLVTDGPSPVFPHHARLDHITEPSAEDAEKIVRKHHEFGWLCANQKSYKATAFKRQEKETIIYCHNEAAWQMSVVPSLNNAPEVIMMADYVRAGWQPVLLVAPPSAALPLPKAKQGSFHGMPGLWRAMHPVEVQPFLKKLTTRAGGSHLSSG